MSVVSDLSIVRRCPDTSAYCIDIVGKYDYYEIDINEFLTALSGFFKDGHLCEPSFDEVVQFLFSIGFLDKTDRSGRLIREWARYNWFDAAIYHLAVWDYPFQDFLDRTSADIANRLPQKSEVKITLNDHEGSLVSLPKIHSENSSSSFDDAIFGKKCSFNFGERLLSLECFSQLMFSVQGKLGESVSPGFGKVLQKLVPSGGARYPYELYLLNPREGYLAEVLPGVYHYEVGGHNLIRLSDKIGTVGGLGLVFVFVAHLDRCMLKYKQSRYYRVLHNDLGHIVENGNLFLVNFGYSLERIELDLISEISSEFAFLNGNQCFISAFHLV